MKMLPTGANVLPCKEDRIFEQTDFYKLFTLNYWQRQWEHKQITALLRSYRLFQAFSYLQCPFLTLALCEWFGANKNNWRQFSSTSTNGCDPTSLRWIQLWIEEVTWGNRRVNDMNSRNFNLAIFAMRVCWFQILPA